MHENIIAHIGCIELLKCYFFIIPTTVILILFKCNNM